MRVQTRALVTAKREVAPRHFQFSLRCPSIARVARAGQFVHVLPRPHDDDEIWSFDPLLRRAFSVMDVQGDEFHILFRVEGRGTSLLSQAREEQWLDLIGPLGNGFSLPNGSHKGSAILVGGGVGVPPMVLTARELKARGVAPQVLLGARSAKDVLCEAQFDALDVPVRVATDDGSRGHSGRVDALLASALDESASPVFACGPYPMLRAVAALCAAKNRACQVSLEENMPCGIGVCNGCVVPTLAQGELPGDDYGRYKRICVHGPACDAREIDWS